MVFTNCVKRIFWCLSGSLVAFASAGAGDREIDLEPPLALETAVQRGQWYLQHKAYLPPDIDQALFDSLWRIWPEPLHSQAEAVSLEERRRMAFSRYGLMEHPDRGVNGPPLGYVPVEEGGWVMNCLACHAGKVGGETIVGLPNSHTALQTFAEDSIKLKLLRFQPLAHLEKGMMAGIPLSFTNGSTNAVVFGIVLGALRNPDMSVDTTRPIPVLTHHDADAPPFWNVRKKSRLYIDGFAPKTARPLVQFMLIPRNDRETVLAWEDDYEDVLAWIESLEAPAYPWPIDYELAARGEQLFGQSCAECHGTYGNNETYPEVTISMDVVGTDPVRLNALTPEHRRWMQSGWMSRFGRDEVILDPGGYVAPPLDGVWASAPYLHNGSVPTLWHLFHPGERPAVWLRTEDGYDRQRIGLEVSEFDSIPEEVEITADRRRYFDTQLTGKSAAGHEFPDVLTEDEKRAVIEYLKTL